MVERPSTFACRVISYFAVVSAGAGAGATVVSTGAGATVVSTGAGATVVSFVSPSFLSPLLLQATIAVAINAIANNFFIFCAFLGLFEIFQTLYQKKKKVTRPFNKIYWKSAKCQF
jgi:hypothetical protein